MISSAVTRRTRGSPIPRTLGLTFTAAVGAGLFLVGCSPDRAVEPSARANAPEVSELARSAGCRFSDNQATKTRTVTSACGNAGVRAPSGWSIRVQPSAQPTGPRAASRAPGFHGDAITAIPNPDAAYLSTTNKIDISSLADGSTHTSVSDGFQTFFFSTSMQKLQVGVSWATWSSPPESESATPALLFTQFVNSLTFILARPASVVGFELEPFAFGVFTFTVDFYAGSVLVGTIIRDVEGNSGALLFAGRSDGAPIDGVVVSVVGDPSGFGIAQLRYSPNNTWATRAPLPTGRRGVAVATANGIVYAIGGNSSTGAAQRTNQAYDPATNTWSSKALLPAPRQNGNGAANIAGNIYVAGGQDAAGTLTRTLYRYSSTTNVWTARANMPAVGGCGGSAMISSRLYVFSGCTRIGTGPQVGARLLHRYNPGTNTWAILRAAPAVHQQPAVAAIGGKLYVIGGNSATGGATNRTDVYNPATNTWSTVAAMPAVRAAMAGVAAAGKLYVIGGRNGATYLSIVQAYDPATNSWAARAALPGARAELGASVVSGLIYAVGGRNGAGVLATNQRYTP